MSNKTICFFIFTQGMVDLPKMSWILRSLETVIVRRLISEAPPPFGQYRQASLVKLLVDLFGRGLSGSILSRSEYHASASYSSTVIRTLSVAAGQIITGLLDICWTEDRIMTENTDGNTAKQNTAGSSREGIKNA